MNALGRRERIVANTNARVDQLQVAFLTGFIVQKQVGKITRDRLLFRSAF